MSRQEKKTRIRVVPPKLQLRGQDALTGSYPTNVRFSLDGRTGNYKVGYNDVQTIVFGSRSNGTSWQDNLVAYWTMQRNIPDTGYVSNFALESEAAPKNSSFPYLDFELADDPIASSIAEYGFKENFPFSGKGYNVNVNEGQPANNIVFPTPEVNKSYEFYPTYSVFGQTDTKVFLTNPLLVQYLDSNKTACAFDGNWDDGPDGFTVAGWFKINDASGVQNAWTLLKGPQRSNVAFDVDYSLGIYSPNPGEKKLYMFIASGSGNAYVEQSGIYLDSNIFDSWFHIAATYDGKTDRAPDPDPKGILDNNSLKIYVNGERIVTDPISVLGGFNGFNSGSSPTYGISLLEYWYGGIGAQEITGSVADIGFFNRELTSTEIAEIYYNRVPLHKKRRVIAGTSIDLDNDPYPVDSGEYMTTFNRDGMLVTGSIVKGVGDNPEWVHFSPGQEMQPFHDEQQFAADAKGASVQNPFFATGSAETLVGEGFNSPLWSKNKIEIPIPVATDTELYVATGKLGNKFETSYNSPMAYYNFQTNTWEPIGVGLPLNVTSSLEDYYGYYPIGFPNSLLPVLTRKSQLSNIGYAGNGFGFPFHPKFHATASQTLDMSKYITETFVLEKAVLEMGNLTYELVDIDSTIISSRNPVSVSCATFFILNQRYNQNYNYNFEFNQFTVRKPVSASVPINYPLTKDDYDSNKTTSVDTVRDIIGFSQLFSVASLTPLKDLGFLTSNLQELLPITSNDIVIRNQTPTYLGVQYFNVKPVFSMSMGSPPLGINLISANFLSYYNNLSTDVESQFFGYDGYRNGLSLQQPTTRGLTNDLFASYNLDPQITAFIKTTFNADTTSPAEKFKVNPYILNPKDKLILGFQMPISQIPVEYINTSAAGVESKFTIHETVSENLPAKLVLYGSYIRENKEYNDGTNQLLSSETIHEVIE